MKSILRMFVLLVLACGSGAGASSHGKKAAGSDAAPDLGSRLELFVDHTLIESMDGVELEVQQPRRAEKVFVFDQPWEGNIPFHVAVFKDGETYRMYYRGSSAVDYITGKSWSRGRPGSPPTRRSSATPRAATASTGPVPPWGRWSSTAPGTTTSWRSGAPPS